MRKHPVTGPGNPSGISEMRKHLILTATTGLSLRLFFVWRFPAAVGDTGIYEKLARNWLDHAVYGLLLGGQLTPADLRVPGYPAFLAAIYALLGRLDPSGRMAVMLAQAVLDLGTCFLTAALAARLAPETLRSRVTLAALWLAATCPFLANYAAVPLTEVLATFLTAAALFFLLEAMSGVTGSGGGARRISSWFAGGLLVGVGSLVRPETPLILAAVAFVLLVRWRRTQDWPKLIRAGALMAAGLLVPLLPWAARNWHALHRVQFLAPRYSELPGERVPHGFYAWTNTWLVRFRDVYLTIWKLDNEPIHSEDLPASAFDTAEEWARVAALLERHNTTLTLSPELDGEFGRLARERSTRHPLRTYLWVPLCRAAIIWFTPRIELLPYSGHFWPPGKRWEEDPVDFSVTVGFTLLNFLYVGLGLTGVYLAARHLERKPWSQSGLVLLVTFILVRTAFVTQVETPEPRYVLECFPALLALAAQVWARPVASAPPAQLPFQSAECIEPNTLTGETLRSVNPFGAHTTRFVQDAPARAKR